MLRCDGGRTRREEEAGGARGDTLRAEEEGRHGARVGVRACPIYPIRPKVTSRGFFSE